MAKSDKPNILVIFRDGIGMWSVDRQPQLTGFPCIVRG